MSDRKWMRHLVIWMSAFAALALVVLLVALAQFARLSASTPAASAPPLGATGLRWNLVAQSVAVMTPTATPIRALTEVAPATAVVAQYPGIRANWIADLTVEDDSLFSWGETFTKTWRLANVGSETWPTDTVLSFVRGAALGKASDVPVGAVAPAATVDIAVRLAAPNKTGRYVSGWALTTEGARIPGSDVWVVIQSTEPVALAELAPVRGKFELGGHVSQGFTHAAQMREAGMAWAKVQARYGEDMDLRPFIAAAHAQGFKALVSAVGPASMVSEAGFSRRVSEWMASIAASGADAIEVWNEPNLPREWRNGYISPRAYTNLLCTAYSAIRQANRGTLVISAAPAPTGFFNGCTANGCDDAFWLEGLLTAGAARCFDYLGAHHNAGATAPSARTGHPADPDGRHHSWYFLPQTELYYEQFAGKRQVFYTELGYLSADGFGWIPEGFSWAGNISTAMQAAWLAEAASLGRESSMVRAIVIWNVDATCYGDCGNAEDPQGGYAIVRPGGVCPACETLKDLQLP